MENNLMKSKNQRRRINNPFILVDNIVQKKHYKIMSKFKR